MKGFCPSFVTVDGGKLKQRHRRRRRPCAWRRCRSRRCRALGQTYDIIVTGVGGTGVVTIGGILGMAAHLEGKGVGVLDMAGLAQKGGAVYSHMRIAERPEDIHAIRIAAGGADLVLGGDIVVAGNKKVLAAVKHGRTDDGDQHRRVPARRFHPQRRFLAADRAAQARHRRRRRPREDPFHRCDARRNGAVRQHRRRQYLPGRLCLSARRHPARGRVDRAGDRAQRRSRGDEQGGLPLGPPRRRRSRRGRGAGQARAGGDQRRAQAVAVARRDGRAPRRLPHRLSGRGLCRALSPLGREGQGGRGGARAGQDAVSPRRSRAICSS